MLSTILITFIYCGPNKWNNQGPLIDAVSGAGGCMGVLKGHRGKKLGSPLESHAVINERRTATNYMHRPEQEDIHIQYIQSVSLCPPPSPLSDLVSEKHMLLHSSDALSQSVSFLSPPPPLLSFLSHGLIDYWKSMRSSIPYRIKI